MPSPLDNSEERVQININSMNPAQRARFMAYQAQLQTDNSQQNSTNNKTNTIANKTLGNNNHN